MNFGYLVKGSAQGRFGNGLRQAFAGVLCLLQRIRPVAVQLQKLSPPYQTMPAVRDDVRLRGTPSLQSGRPFPRPPQIIDFAAGIQHAAVHPSCVESGDVAGRDGHHGLVKQRQTTGNFSLPNQRTSLALKAECDQIFVAEALTNRGGLHKLFVRSKRISLSKAAETLRQQQVSPFYAIRMTVEQAAGTREPASRLRHFSIEQRGKAKPKRASYRWLGVPLAQERLMGASQKVRSFRFPSNQESSLREFRKILWIERHLLIGHHKLRKGSSPRLPVKGVTTLLQGARSRIRVLRSRPILHSCKSVYLNSVCVAPAGKRPQNCEKHR